MGVSDRRVAETQTSVCFSLVRTRFELLLVRYAGGWLVCIGFLYASAGV